MNREIIPACMPEDFDDILDVAESVVGNVKTIQLDIMDGKYVPEKTWPFFRENDRYLNDLIKEKIGLPIWENINYELDLMVERPELNLDTWLHVGASRVIFHYKSVFDWELIKNIDFAIHDFVQFGVAVTIHDIIEDIFPLIDDGVVDFVQVMGISQIGYMGEPFDYGSIDIIKALRDRYPDLIISIDGGVSEDTIPLLRDAGAMRFVSGSSIFAHGIITENIDNLSELINED